MRIIVSIAVAAAAVQKSLLCSNAVQMTQKDWTTSRTKCTAAGVGICNWMGMKRLDKIKTDNTCVVGA